MILLNALEMRQFIKFKPSKTKGSLITPKDFSLANDSSFKQLKKKMEFLAIVLSYLTLKMNNFSLRKQWASSLCHLVWSGK